MERISRTGRVEYILKKKLLFIVEAMGGGVFTYTVDLTNNLVNKYDVYVAYGTRKQTPIDYENYFDKRVHLIMVKNFGRTVRMDKDIKAFFEIKNIARKIKPDFIHLHSSKAGVLGRIAFAFGKIPVYYTPHGYSFLMSGISKLKRFMYYFIEKMCALSGATTIACSPGEYEESLKLTKRAKLVNNGINISELDKYYDDRVGNSGKIVTLGRISYQKNPKEFNNIAELLPNQKFTWIGDGELSNQLVSSNIEITGWLQRKEALKKISNSDIFVLTSLWEGLPLSLLEAMYLGKICIVSDVVGNKDVIKHGINGFICKNAMEYAGVITSIQQGKVNTVEILRNARKDILRLYNTKVMSEKYIDIYEAN